MLLLNKNQSYESQIIVFFECRALSIEFLSNFKQHDAKLKYILPNHIQEVLGLRTFRFYKHWLLHTSWFLKAMLQSCTRIHNKPDSRTEKTNNFLSNHLPCWRRALVSWNTMTPMRIRELPPWTSTEWRSWIRNDCPLPRSSSNLPQQLLQEGRPTATSVTDTGCTAVDPSAIVACPVSRFLVLLKLIHLWPCYNRFSWKHWPPLQMKNWLLNICS